MTDPTPIPLPSIPKQWTIQSILTFAGTVALFVLGCLTAVGITVPDGVAADVKLVVGAAGVIASIAAALVAHLSKNSLKKAAVTAGMSIRDIARL